MTQPTNTETTIVSQYVLILSLFIATSSHAINLFHSPAPSPYKLSKGYRPDFKGTDSKENRAFNVRFHVMAISGSDTPNPPSKVTAPTETHCVQCESCGFTEECTVAYIVRVRERYHGRWICGLCIEAVKDEALRSVTLISMEEALERHMSFCEKFRAWNPSDETEHPIFAMGRILRRSLDSPRAARTKSSSALPGLERVKRPPLLRSESCFSALSI